MANPPDFSTHGPKGRYGRNGARSSQRGFLRDARGRITTIRVPGAKATTAQKLNDRGQITGYFDTTNNDPRVQPTGFLLDRGRFTKIAVPGVVTTTRLRPAVTAVVVPATLTVGTIRAAAPPMAQAAAPSATDTGSSLSWARCRPLT
jgi:hypothetical protein